MSARGLVSIDVRVELSIVALSQVSIDVVEVVSIDIVEVVSIDDLRFSLQMERSKSAGYEKISNSSLMLLVLIGMYLKDKKKNYVSNYDSK